MDRLTKRDEFGISRVCHYPDRDGDELLYNQCYGCTHRTKCNADILERLAQYEDAVEEAERRVNGNKVSEGRNSMGVVSEK